MHVRSILLLAALSEEADACLRGRGEQNVIAGFPVRHVKIGDAHIRIATTGIGKVNIAGSAMLLHGMAPADLFIVAGTAGALTGAADHCFWIADAVQHDYGARIADRFVTYNPGSWPMGEAVVTPFPAMSDPGVGLPTARIASGDAFVACPQMSARLRDDLGATIIDMETAAIAQCAQRLGVPWAAIKATTDEANGDSAQDFSANLLAASARAGAAIDELIDRLVQPGHH